MTDAHVHLENGPLTAEYALSFINAAYGKGITHLQILDHTHRFQEFEPMYEPLKATVPEQREWLENKDRKFKNTLEDYQTLIRELKAMPLPIRVSFGLEVCYTPESEAFLQKLLPQYHFDFLVGAVHSVKGICYDMPYSKAQLWDKYSTNELYAEYLKSLLACVRSGLFTQLAHPDTFKLFGYYPTADLSGDWRALAKELKAHGMKAECNTGLSYRYGHKDIGLSDEVLRIFLEEGVEIVTASDAHWAKDVGTLISEAEQRIRQGQTA